MENNIEGLLVAQIDRYSSVNAKLDKEDQLFDIKKNVNRDSLAENEKNATPLVQKLFQTKKKQKSTDERPVNPEF